MNKNTALLTWFRWGKPCTVPLKYQCTSSQSQLSILSLYLTDFPLENIVLSLLLPPNTPPCFFSPLSLNACVASVSAVSSRIQNGGKNRQGLWEEFFSSNSEHHHKKSQKGSRKGKTLVYSLIPKSIVFEKVDAHVGKGSLRHKGGGWKIRKLEAFQRAFSNLAVSFIAYIFRWCKSLGKQMRQRIWHLTSL